ncbi:MAG: glutathione S-transferase family protein [Proteobacteria bacterium]|nr:glutathione S-transferase family protein [Pseudomonadota bacterium]
MIQIYGSPNTSAGRCYWTLEEVGAAYQAIDINFRNGEHKKPDYLAINPNGKVPVLKDGDFVLWESMAINFYLAEKYQPSLLGTTLEDKAHIQKWSFWSLAEYQKPLIDIFIQKVFVPEDRRDSSVIQKGLERLKPLNELLNQHLDHRSFMVGASFTLADINVASVAKICPVIGEDLSHYPAIKGWLERMLQRPAALKLAQLEVH